MNWDYEVLNEDQAMAQRFQLLPDGEYDAYVESFEPKISSSGNQYVNLLLNIFDNNGKPHPVFDIQMTLPSMVWKMRHFCYSAGLEESFEAKKYHPSMSVGKKVRVFLRTKKGDEIPFNKLNGKPVGSKYPDKNVIDDYLVGNKIVPIDTKKEDFFDDPVPF